MVVWGGVCVCVCVCMCVKDLDKFLDGLEDVSVELLHLDGRQVHVTQQTVDDLEQRLLHAG